MDQGASAGRAGSRVLRAGTVALAAGRPLDGPGTEAILAFIFAMRRAEFMGFSGASRPLRPQRTIEERSAPIVVQGV